MNTAILASYARAFLATALAAIFAIEKLPWQFTTTEWMAVANTIWISTIPVVIRWLNPNDPAFGLGSK